MDAIPTLLLSAAAGAMTVAAVAGATTVSGSVGPSGLVAVAPGALGLGLLARVAVGELTTDRDAFGLTRRDLGAGLAVAVAAPLTRLLAVETGLGAVVAASLVGLLAAYGSRYGVPAYCGAFVGMAGPGLFDLTAVAAAGVVTGLLYVAAKRVFNGFGGKLGTLAFVGCGVLVLGTGADYPVTAPAVDPWTAGVATLAAAVAALCTYRLSVHRDEGPVVGSAVVGLVAGLLAPPLLGSVGPAVASAAFCASFVGMSRPDRLGTLPVVFAGCLSGALFVAAGPAFAASGGKLGTLAFVACLLVDGAVRVGSDLPVEAPTPT
jgi:hypothetical protein